MDVDISPTNQGKSCMVPLIFVVKYELYDMKGLILATNRAKTVLLLKRHLTIYQYWHYSNMLHYFDNVCDFMLPFMFLL